MGGGKVGAPPPMLGSKEYMTCTCMYAVLEGQFHLTNVERVGNCALEGESGLAKECDREEGLRGKSGKG